MLFHYILSCDKALLATQGTAASTPPGFGGRKAAKATFSPAKPRGKEFLKPEAGQVQLACVW